MLVEEVTHTIHRKTEITLDFLSISIIELEEGFFCVWAQIQEHLRKTV